MAKLTKELIVPGVTAYLSQPVLEGNAAVTKTMPQATLAGAQARPGPFLCVEADAEVSIWSPITHESHSKFYPRLELIQEWRADGPKIWLQTRQYLNDGANLYQGEHGHFIAAELDSADGAWGKAPVHARLLQPGVAAVRGEVEKQRGRRIRPLK